TAGHPFRRGALTLATAAAAAGTVYIWLPNGDYRPIQPGERGTLQGGIAELASLQTGRPSLTPKRARQLHGAPTKASQTHPSKPDPSSQQTGTTSSTTTTGGTTTTTQSSTTSPSTTPVAPGQTTSTPTTTTTSTDTTSTDTTATTTPTTTTTPLP